MARTLYAARPADYVANPADGTPIAGALINIWPAATGGTQITDLRAEDGTTAVTQVVADATGNFRFFGPDPYQAPLWATTGGSTTKRFLVEPVDISSRLVTAETTVGTTASTVTSLGTRTTTLETTVAGLGAPGAVTGVQIGAADPSPLPPGLLVYYEP